MKFNVGTLRSLIREALLNAYKVLDIDKNASADEIKTAYRKLALKYHPDRNHGMDTTQQMSQINQANDILNNPTSRSQLDRELRSSQYTSYKKPQPQPTTQKSSQPRKISTEYYTFVGTTSQGKRSAKFWSIAYPDDLFGYNTYRLEDKITITTRWGKIGSVGQTKTESLSLNDAKRFVRQMIVSKVSKGYQVGYEKDKNAEKQQQQKQQQQQQRSVKTTYKIYGRKGSSAVHTRYRGRVYVPSTNKSEFRPGDVVNVSIGSDGRLTVSNNKIHEIWDFINEALIHSIDNLIFEYVMSRLD